MSEIYFIVVAPATAPVQLLHEDFNMVTTRKPLQGWCHPVFFSHQDKWDRLKLQAAPILSYLSNGDLTLLVRRGSHIIGHFPHEQTKQQSCLQE